MAQRSKGAVSVASTKDAKRQGKPQPNPDLLDAELIVFDESDAVEMTAVPESDDPLFGDDPVIAPMLPDSFDADLVMGTFKRWSASAVECYVREANCDGCYYAGFFKDKPYTCKMNLAVEQLLQTLGEPSKNLLNKYG